MKTKIESCDIERLYRAIADREPTRELLQLVYEMAGNQCDLRPPRPRTPRV
jgi:hypothetical protein